MYGTMLEIENAVFPENIVFSQKTSCFFFVGMTFSSAFEAPGIGILRINSRIERIPNIPETELPGNAGQARIFR